MDYIIKIYNSLNDTRPKVTIEDFESLKFQEDLTSFSSWSCTTSQIEWILKNDIIKIIEVGDTDNIIFNWFIDDLEVWIEKINITFKDFKWLFQNKKVLSDKSFTNKTPKEIIDNLIADYNSRWDNWICTSDITTTITKQYKIWDNYFDIINEICDFLQIQWIIKNNEIIIKNFVWVDRTLNADFFEFIYNWTDIAENNIITINRKTTPIYNIIIWIDKDNNKTIKQDNTSITNNWPIANTISVRVWSLEAITQAFLDFYKTEKYYYEIQSSLLEANLNIWDKVKVRIEEAGDYLDFEWNAFIIWKETTFENNSKFIKYSISTNNIKIKSFIQRMRDIDSNINFFAI